MLNVYSHIDIKALDRIMNSKIWNGFKESI